MTTTDFDYKRLDGDLAEPDLGITSLYVELDPDRTVCREIGLDVRGDIVHRMPSRRHRHGERGFWDLQPIPHDLGEVISRDVFIRLWEMHEPDAPPALAPRPSLRERLRRLRRG